MDFLDNSLQIVEQFMIVYGYWAVFFGVMLENAGLPVPGETILLVAGYFAASGEFSLFSVMLIAATGAITGDNIGFAVGRRYGRGFLLRVGKYFFLTPARFVYFESFFARFGSKTILVARFITGLRVIGALLAGASGMPWRTFFVYNVAGAILWATTIAALGYFFGQSLPFLLKWVGRSGTILLVAVVIAAAILWHFYKPRAAKTKIK
jgi:membrane protein DedA with SNARE-associated domain